MAAEACRLLGDLTLRTSSIFERRNVLAEPGKFVNDDGQLLSDNYTQQKLSGGKRGREKTLAG